MANACLKAIMVKGDLGCPAKEPAATDTPKTKAEVISSFRVACAELRFKLRSKGKLLKGKHKISYAILKPCGTRFNYVAVPLGGFLKYYPQWLDAGFKAEGLDVLTLAGLAFFFGALQGPFLHAQREVGGGAEEGFLDEAAALGGRAKNILHSLAGRPAVLLKSEGRARSVSPAFKLEGEKAAVDEGKMQETIILNDVGITPFKSASRNV